jgi:transposase
VRETREVVIRRVLAKLISVEEAALLLGLSVRQIFRLRATYLEAGGDGLVHQNTGRPPANRITDQLRRRVLGLAAGRYAGINDSHLAELLASRDRIILSRRSLQRILRAAGRPSPRRHRATRYRQRRDRRTAAGMLLQIDGSRHRWFGPDGPFATLHLAVDDATGAICGATFREEEDAAGYFQILHHVLTRFGRPVAVYSDRHGLFVREDKARDTLEAELTGIREPTQLGRAFAELAIEPIFAHSPQAKGRVERAFGTIQDRLVSELRLAKARTITHANRLLPGFCERYDARFGIAAIDPVPAWRPLAPGVDPLTVCCFKYRRAVGSDNTVRLVGAIVQLPPRGAFGSWAGHTVEARQAIDGSWTVHAPRGELLARGPQSALVRAQPYRRAQIPSVPPLTRGATSPWRRGLQDWHPAAARRAMIAQNTRRRT